MLVNSPPAPSLHLAFNTSLRFVSFVTSKTTLLSSTTMYHFGYMDNSTYMRQFWADLYAFLVWRRFLIHRKMDSKTNYEVSTNFTLVRRFFSTFGFNHTIYSFHIKFLTVWLNVMKFNWIARKQINWDQTIMFAQLYCFGHYDTFYVKMNNTFGQSWILSALSWKKKRERKLQHMKVHPHFQLEFTHTTKTIHFFPWLVFGQQVTKIRKSTFFLPFSLRIFLPPYDDIFYSPIFGNSWKK